MMHTLLRFNIHNKDNANNNKIASIIQSLIIKEPRREDELQQVL